MKKLAIALVVGFAAASACMAETFLEVRANTRAMVFLDGEFQGNAPLNIADVEPGRHEVKLVDSVTGRDEVHSFNSPWRVDTRRRIDAGFAPAPRVSRVYVESDYYDGRRIYWHDGRRYWMDGAGHRHYLDRNQRARVRNVGLGATGLGLVTGSKLLTGAGLGAIIANEFR